MDRALLHALNAFADHHDAVADPLSLYVTTAEPLFAVGIVVLLTSGGRTLWRARAAIAATASCAVALAIAQLVARIVDRPRPFVADPASVHLLVRHAADP